MVEQEENYSGDYVPIKTNWYEKGVPTMWHFVNQQLDKHYDQAHGWKMATELTGLYHSRLKTYRESFVNEWRNSPAQEAFIVELDKLIESVKNTTDIASANYSASVDIPSALFEAKMKLEPIVQAYTAAETDQGKINRGEMDPPEEGKDTPADIMNSKKYDAAPVMYELSRQIVRAQQAMIQPAPYTAPGRPVDSSSDYGSPNLPPAIVPPVMPVPPPPPAPTPPGQITALPTPVAPDLSGLQLTQRPPVPTLGLPTSLPPSMPGLIGPLPPPTGIPPMGPLTTRPTMPGPTALQGMPGVPGAPRTPAAMPPGGVIGAQPGAPGAAGARGAGARPLPPGGMINGAGAGAGRGGMGVPGGPGAPGRGGAPMGGAPGRPGSGQHGDEDGENFDPDTQWQVAHGVAPVVDTPDTPGVINPGPAIGLDR